MSNTLIPDSSTDVKSRLTSQWLMQRGWASVLGIGALLGVGIAVQIAGSAALAALPIAAIAAIGAELNAAQLAAIPSLSISPWLNFTANWALLLAKMITAAIAAAGFAGYLLSLLGQPNLSWLVPIALLWVAIVSALFAIKLLPAKISQPILLAILLLLLLLFLGAGWKGLLDSQLLPISRSVRSSASFGACLQASALMFFAYTNSQRLPPFHQRPQSDRIKAAMTLLTMGLYVCIAWIGMNQMGSQAFGEAAGTNAPLAIALRLSGLVSSSQLVAVGAAVVLGGIVANLVLEAAKTLQGMARQQDAPQLFARSSPIATLAVGGAIVCLILTSEVETLWSFGAFAALLYAIIAHLAVLNLSASQRIYPRLLTGISFSLCLFLAFWINPNVWLVSLGLVAVGLVWRGINQWVKHQSEG